MITGRFFRQLLGKYWVVFEIMYLIGMLLVLGLIGATAGSLMRDNFNIPYMAGVLLMMLAIGFFTFRGSALIEKFLASWSLLLYGIYAVIFVAAVYKFGDVIQGNFAAGEIKPPGGRMGFIMRFTILP